jgi:hypothetical protein
VTSIALGMAAATEPAVGNLFDFRCNKSRTGPLSRAFLQLSRPLHDGLFDSTRKMRLVFQRLPWVLGRVASIRKRLSRTQIVAHFERLSKPTLMEPHRHRKLNDLLITIPY